MKTLLNTLLAVAISNLVLAQTTSENYVKTTNFQVKTTNGVVDAVSGATLMVDDKQETITYYDGLGRPKQSISKQAGGNKEDIITPIVYDDLGRQTKQFSPYTRSFSNSANALNYEATLVPNINGAIGPLNAQYLLTHAEDINSAAINPYSETHFEASPLNRVLEQGAPGADWAGNKTTDSDHTIKFDYQTNVGADYVRLYKVAYVTNVITNEVVPSTPRCGFLCLEKTL